VAAPIWRAFMDQALKNTSIEQFPKYEKEETGKDVLDGKIEGKDEIKVCKIPGKKDYCLASDACPDDLVEKKDFANAHSILYYVKKDDPRGDKPENPEDEPQFKNWEKAVRDWVKDADDFPDKIAPDEKCESDDFDDVKPEIKIKAPSDGSTVTSSSFTIRIDADSDFGIKKVTLKIEGNEVKSDDGSFNYDYSVPSDKKNTDINIEAKVTDKADKSASASITVHTNIP